MTKDKKVGDDGAKSQNEVTNGPVTGGNKKSSKRADISILKYDRFAYSNFYKFERELEEVAGYEFGDLFSFCKTGKYPSVELPSLKSVSDLKQEEINRIDSRLSEPERTAAEVEIEEKYTNMGTLQTNALKKALEAKWLNEIKIQGSEEAKRKQDKIKLYWLIRGQMSVESIDKVKEHLMERWAILEAKQDPLELWEALKQTHTSYSTGLKKADAAKAREAYYKFRQYASESLTSYKDRFEVLLRAMESMGLDTPSEDDQAADFLQRLNDRFAARRITIENNTKLGGNYPTTLFEAYRMVSELSDLPTVNTTSTSVFATGAKSEETPTKNNGNGYGKNKTDSKDKSDENKLKSTTTESTKKEFKGKCFSCDKVGHRASECTVKKPESKKTSQKKTYFTQEEVLDFFGFTTLCFKASASLTKEELITHVLLDNQAQNSIFGNSRLLQNLRDKKTPSRYNGLAGGGGLPVLATQCGSFMGIEDVDYSPDAEANILSWSQVKKTGLDIQYDSVADKFILTTPNATLEFKPFHDLYAMKFENVVLMTRSEEVEARLALEIQKRLAYPAKSGVEHFLKSGAMNNVPIGTKALENLEESIIHIQGKSVRQQQSYSPEVKGNVEKSSTAIHCDLMFLKGDVSNEKLNFFISVSDFGLTIIKALKGKGLAEITKALADVFRIYKTNKWEITKIYSDGEYNFENALELLTDAPPHHQRGAGKHDGRIEERIRRIKDNVRAIQAGLPFKLGDALTVWASYYSTYVLNLMPTRAGNGISPREILTGVRPEFKKCLPIAFGDFCQVLERNPDNSLKARTVTALALLPTGKGPIKFASLTTGKIITREQFRIVRSVPFELIAIVKALQEKGVLGIDDLLQPNQGRVDNEESELSKLINQDETPATDVHEQNNVDVNLSSENNSEADNTSTLRRSERIYTYAVNVATPKERLVIERDPKIDTNCMTIKQAMELYPKDKVEEAVVKELTNMTEKQVFKLVSKEERRKLPSDVIVPSKFFLKDKGQNLFIELKGRFVGGGHRQSETIYERKTSPTVATSTIFIVLVDAATNEKYTVTMDIPCAYLHAAREGLPKVYIRLSKEVTEIFVRLNPQYAICVETDGTLVVEVTKGLYGLIESGHTWYTHLTKFLFKLGFKRSDHDKCLFFNDCITIAVYVDDLLITGANKKSVDELMHKLKDEFGNCKEHTGDKLPFLGMEFIIKKGKVHVKIDLSKILENTKQSVDSPATLNILQTNADSQRLNDTHKEKFHSTVARLLYVAKRTRPDILFAVNYLCTRVLNPTMEDYLKLVRVLRYLYGTSDQELVLSMENTKNDELIMESYIDASYGVHADSKSHSGMIVTLGQGTILGMSTKQKCVSKSSTEAELIAVTDFIGEAMKLKMIAQEITRKGVKLVLYQDNQATINMIKNGTAGARSKHIKIRFDWLKERLEDGDFSIEYKPTKLMIADGMTKGKHGLEFDDFKTSVGVCQVVHDHQPSTATKERAEETQISVVPESASDEEGKEE